MTERAAEVYELFDFKSTKVVHLVEQAGQKLGMAPLEASLYVHQLAALAGVEVPLWKEELSWPEWLHKAQQRQEYLFQYGDDVWTQPLHWLWLAVKTGRTASEMLTNLARLRSQLGFPELPFDSVRLVPLDPLRPVDLLPFVELYQGEQRIMEFLNGLIAPPQWGSCRRTPLELLGWLVPSVERDTQVAALREICKRHDVIATAIGWPLTDPQQLQQQAEIEQMDDGTMSLLIALLEPEEVQVKTSTMVRMSLRRPRVGRLVALTALLHKPLHWIDAQLRAWQAIFGTVPPDADATYLGQRWDDLVARSLQTHGPLPAR